MSNPHLDGNRSTVGQLINSIDWQFSPLGPPAEWPLALSLYVSLMLSSQFPMFLAWGVELAFIYNDAYIDVLGKKHPSALGGRFDEIWREIWPELAPSVNDALAGKTSYFENLSLLVNRNGDEEQTWFTFSYSPILDENAVVQGIFCTCTETTQQIMAEKHKSQEIARLTSLFQNAPGYLAVMREPAHFFEMVNETYYKLAGKRDLIGKPIREALPELEGQGVFELLDGVYRTGEAYVGRALSATFRRKDGTEMERRFVDFVFQPMFDLNGNVNGIFVEGVDVTETVVAASALRESERQLRELANNIPHLAWMANADGYIHWYNDRWYEYTGTTFEDMCGWGWETVHDPAFLPAVIERWKQSLASGESWESTFPLRSATGEFRMFASRAAPLRDESGCIVQWFGTNTDITELIKAQEKLTDASRRKDEFLAMLAHELRNPLAPIRTAAELLNYSSQDEAGMKLTANIISRQVAHMTKLLDDLLDVSRVTRGKINLRADAINMNDLVTQAVEQMRPLAVSKQHEVDVILSNKPATVRGDPTRVIQILVNLLNNAAKYTPPKGQIIVRATVEESDVKVSICDNGIGFTSTLQPHLFELFTQGERSIDRSQGGLGLGLALVKTLVELQGGTVSAYSKGIGSGSEFVLSFPLITDHLPASGPTFINAKSAPLVRSHPVLVVDDNADAAHMMSLLLETLGHHVWVSYDAYDALKKAQEASPSILFLDIGLPGMDGYELAKRLREMKETATSVYVAVTGYGQPKDREMALDSGFDHHLVKPVELEDVLALIEALDK